jgi:hypothetical protein
VRKINKPNMVDAVKRKPSAGKTPAADTADKPLRNARSSGTQKSILDNDRVTIREPLGSNRVTGKGNNKVTIREPLGNKNDKKSSSKNSLGNPLGNSKETIREPLGNNRTTKRLTGNESKILNYLFQNCYNRGQRITSHITLSEITETLGISSRSVSKTTLMRLNKKKFITRRGGKRGNGGFAIYEIPEDIYEGLILDKVTIREPLGNDKVSDRVTDRVTNGPSSSSILNTTTTRQQNLDSSRNITLPANIQSLGLGENHLEQLQNKFSLTAEQIQQSLEAFSYDLENGEMERLKARGVQNLIGYFFGAMKNGGYNSVKEGFISAEELGEQEMLKRLEEKKAAREERQKRIEDLLFEEWLETKTEKELSEIHQPMLGFMDSMHRAALKGHFVDNELVEFKKGFQ